MSRLTFAEAAERVKSGLDIIDVIQRHVILKKTGRSYAGKCPFHNDKSPSMNVSREKGIFKCFSCGVGGDSLTFLMKIENKTFGEIIRDLAQEQSIDIQYEGQQAEVAQTQRDARQKIVDLNEAASQWFGQQLQAPAAQPVLQYLAGRYTNPDDCQQAISAFQLGYAPPGWENLTPHLKSKFDFAQANPDLLNTAGLSNTRDHGQGQYDRFRHRLIIPILDDKGQVVAFGGRALSEEDKPKYLNSPETVLYKKSNILYGFHQAKDSIRQSRSAILMEGYFDVITAHLNGITEAVGSCGTAMTDSHLKLLSRFGAETVFLAFDSDEAGLKAALSAIHLIEPYMSSTELQVKVLIVPNGKDPDDFIRQQGGEAFRTLIQNATHYMAFKFDMAIRDLDFHQAEGRIQAANRLTPLLASIARPATRSEYLKLYAEKIGLAEEALTLEVKRYEQARNPHYGKIAGNFQKQDRKKAISKGGWTSFKRSETIVTENVSDLHSQLTSRQVSVEKNLLKLALYSTESFATMMSLFYAQAPFAFDDPIHQEILMGLQNAGIAQSEAKIDPSDNGFPGTLIEKMNHLYLDQPDVLHTFAELALMAESFGESFDLGEIKGSVLTEKITNLAKEQLTLLANCQRLRQLQALKADASRNDGNQVELTYQFQDRLITNTGPPRTQNSSG
ncbi:DNA primase [Vampirovibrio sp.]|uniref:DNA primase n=1 Tax=Vampirovibrio sp. TaxID=2717857 RepID=UPI0035930895